MKMKRLTFDGNFCDIAQCRDTACRQDGTCTQKEVWERLKQFEDAFGTPEKAERVKLAFMGKSVYEIKEFNGVPLAHLIELAEADKDGRVVVLPCKVGDTVWIIDSVRKLYSAKVRTFFCGHPSAVRGNDDDGHMQMIRTTECDIPMQDIGKTVFLTRGEAEKALRKMQGKEDADETHDKPE